MPLNDLETLASVATENLALRLIPIGEYAQTQRLFPGSGTLKLSLIEQTPTTNIVKTTVDKDRKHTLLIWNSQRLWEVPKDQPDPMDVLPTDLNAN